MAFPLAHPAAVLPLRRFCPRWLCFPALVIGSVGPDLGYLLQAQHVAMFSHQVRGSLVFCVPVGLMGMLMFYALRTPAVKLLPGPYQRALLPLCRLPRAAPWAVVISLWIGAWSHLLWDSWTHKDGWWVQHIPVLQGVVFAMGYHHVRVCLLLWYASSFAGMVWLVLAFEKWKQANVDGHATVPGRAVLRDAMLVAVLLLPIGVMHHLLPRSEPLLYAAAALCGLPAMAVILKLRKAREGTGEDAA